MKSLPRTGIDRLQNEETDGFGRPFFLMCGKYTNPGFVQQLVDISKLGLNSKIKKFSYSFICGKGYSPPPKGGEDSFLSTVCEPRRSAGARFIDVHYADCQSKRRML